MLSDIQSQGLLCYTSLPPRDFNVPHFSKPEPEPELGGCKADAVFIRKRQKTWKTEGKVQVLYSVSFIIASKKFTSIFVIVPCFISRISTRFDMTGFLAGNHCH